MHDQTDLVELCTIHHCITIVRRFFRKYSRQRTQFVRTRFFQDRILKKIVIVRQTGTFFQDRIPIRTKNVEDEVLLVQVFSTHTYSYAAIAFNRFGSGRI